MRGSGFATPGAFFIVLVAHLTHAVEVRDFVVELSATIQQSPPAIRLHWPVAANSSGYQVYRKLANASFSAWGEPLARLDGSANGFIDSTVTPGTVYEYRVAKSTPEVGGYGFVNAGIDCPLVGENHGTVLLVIDDTHAAALADDLNRLHQDLVGDGWKVTRLHVARSDPVTHVKERIQAARAADPNLRAVFLLGHVPVPYSGDIYPDDHVDHQGAWPADVFYADLDGRWPDESVNRSTAARQSNWNIPGDGKFDPSFLPSDVELEIGRVDLANLPAFESWFLDDPKSEVDLLRQYLAKNHAFRHKRITAQARGIVEDHLGVGDYREAFAASGWRNLSAFFGASQVTEADFLTALTSGSYLWAYAAGPGTDTMADGIMVTADLTTQDLQVPFVMLYGSWFTDWNEPDNLLRAVLGSRSYTLASIGAGTPHWFIHPMGMGATLGYCTRLTQNNLKFYPGLRYQRGVHISLMGDPTLRMHVVAPPARLCVRPRPAGGFQLSWTPSPDTVAGYHVYRASSADGPFARLTSAPLNDVNFTDPAPAGGGVYMVRAIKLENGSGGTYFNASQGIFASHAPEVTLVAPVAGTTVNPGENVRLSVEVFGCVSIARVEFFAGTAKLGEQLQEPFVLNWTPNAVASYRLWARATDVNGSSSTSAPALLTVGPFPAGDWVWVEDRVPAQAQVDQLNDAWSWTADAPPPRSGQRAHQSLAHPGVHKHQFFFAAVRMPVASGDHLFTYVYLDPADPPRSVMLEWCAGDSFDWEHRAFWGEDLIAFGVSGTPSRQYLGPLPPAGQWVRLSVPAEAVGLAGQTLHGMSFTLFGGKAAWDRAGKAPGRQPPQVNFIAPLDGQTAWAGSYLTFQANAWDPDGTVQTLGLRVNGASLASTNGPTLIGTWRAETPGTYTFAATAQDQTGLSSTSTVTVTVVRPTSLRVLEINPGAFRFSLPSSPGQQFAIERSTNLLEWSLWNIVSNGPGVLTISDPDFQVLRHRFYRVRQWP